MLNNNNILFFLRPDFAPEDSSGEEEDLEFGFGKKAEEAKPESPREDEKVDRRLQRLRGRQMDDEEDEDDIEEK